MSAVDPERHIAVLNESWGEIFKVPVYSNHEQHIGICQLQGDERNGTKRSQREPPSDRRALHPPPPET
jgi:hypothetical protein